MSWRSHVRGIGERILLASGIPNVVRAMRNNDVLVLAYHNILPGGAPAVGDRSLHLPQRSFTAQLDWLRDRCSVVSLDDALSAPLPAAPSTPRIAITFDDAYRGAVTVGVPELVARGLPATIFVAPTFVGGGTFWWDVLAQPAEAGLDAGVRHHALEACRGEDAVVREWARSAGQQEEPMPGYATCASEDELRAAAAQSGISVGSHTWSHANLTRLDGEALCSELKRPLAWLEERFSGVSRTLSYPYGSCSAHVARAAAAAGYRAGLRIDGGWIRGRPRDPFAIPRLNVPAGLSIDGFILRTAGLLCR
ncbi:MAG TPA: polysaccharide deacetylase family protein [Gemmatimonadaceae bacterium]|nr:polysaccharide deacetylase family protein [Gemmatimonadaceae bacterium]